MEFMYFKSIFCKVFIHHPNFSLLQICKNLLLFLFTYLALYEYFCLLFLYWVEFISKTVNKEMEIDC